MSATLTARFSTNDGAAQSTNFERLVYRTLDLMTRPQTGVEPREGIMGNLVHTSLREDPSPSHGWWTIVVTLDFDADEVEYTRDFVHAFGCWLSDTAWMMVEDFSVTAEAIFQSGMVQRWDAGDFTSAEDSPGQRCVVCAEWPDYCQGHGEDGSVVWNLHDDGDHSNCHVDACQEAWNAEAVRVEIEAAAEDQRVSLAQAEAIVATKRGLL